MKTTRSLSHTEKKKVKDLADNFHKKIEGISENAYKELTDSHYKRKFENADKDGGGQENVEYFRKIADEISTIKVKLKQSVAADTEIYIESLFSIAGIRKAKHLRIEFADSKNAFTIKGYNDNIEEMQKEFGKLDKNTAGYEEQKIAYEEIKKIADLMNDKGYSACIEIDKAMSAAYGNIKKSSETNIKDIQNRTKKATQVSFAAIILGAAMAIIGPLALGMAAAGSGVLVGGLSLMLIGMAASKIVPGKINSMGREEAIKDIQPNEYIDKLVNVIKEGNRQLLSNKQNSYSQGQN